MHNAQAARHNFMTESPTERKILPEKLCKGRMFLFTKKT
jgi:hypothetical protein